MSEWVYCLATSELPPPSETVLALTPELYGLIASRGEYRLREQVEEDESWRQIIPYAVVRCGAGVLLVERLQGGSEARLHLRKSIGLGGHINPVDQGNARDVMEAGLTRELREELDVGAFRAEAIGLIHTQDGAVSRVHSGVLYEVRTLGEVSIRETSKLRGAVQSWREVARSYAELEGWSRLTYDFLRARAGIPDIVMSVRL